MTRIYQAKIQDGKIELNDRGGFQQAVHALEGHEVEVTLRKARKKRTLSQNAWYWSTIVTLLAEAAGYEHEEMHEALKIKFLTIRGETPLPTVRSTTELTTAEFTEYAEQCRRFGAEFFGINIPDPGMTE